MKGESDLAGIVLAAGRSRRFGADKLLHPLPDGTPMVLASIEALRAVLPRTVAVVRRDNEPLRDLLAAHNVACVIAAHADHGMGLSIAAGVAATYAASGWIVALGDMPYIRQSTVARMARALRHGAALVAPAYQGRRGHPVGFSASLRDRLLRLEGDQGARAVLQERAHELMLIACDDPGVLVDIDRNEAILAVHAAGTSS